MSKMPTETRLMLIHGNAHIPLETVAKEYLNLSPEVARRKIRRLNHSING